MRRWAVIGIGTAGRARARAINTHPGSTLVSVYGGRHADEFDDRKRRSFADALLDVDAVALATPTSLHVEQAHAALLRGLHVVVEFPLSLDAGTAETLLDMARQRQQMLHVAHIELLNPQLDALASSSWRRLSFQMFRRESPSEKNWRTALIAPLHRLARCGAHPPPNTSAKRTQATLEVSWQTPAGQRVSLRIDRSTEQARSWSLTAGSDERRTTIDSRSAPRRRFACDHHYVVDRLAAWDRTGTPGPSYVDDRQIVSTLAAAERLDPRRD